MEYVCKQEISTAKEYFFYEQTKTAKDVDGREGGGPRPPKDGIGPILSIKERREADLHDAGTSRR